MQSRQDLYGSVLLESVLFRVPQTELRVQQQ